MFKRIKVLLLTLLTIVVLFNLASTVHAQPQRLKFPYKNMLYEGVVFTGKFEMKDSFKGDYTGGKVAVRFSTTGEMRKEKQFFLGVDLTHVPYNFNLLDSSVDNGNGKGHITEFGLSNQWFRFKSTSIKDVLWGIGMKFWTERLSYESGSTEYERTQTNWLIYSSLDYKIIKTTGLINRIGLGARVEIPAGSPKFEARQVDSRGIVTSDIAQPVKRREYRGWTEFGPIFPLGNYWTLTTLLHLEYKWREQDKRNYFPVGGILIIGESNADIFRLEVIPEFSKDPDPLFRGHLSIDVLNLGRQLF